MKGTTSISVGIKRSRNDKFKLKKIRDLQSINDAYAKILANLNIKFEGKGISVQEGRMICAMLKDYAGMIENEKLKKMEIEFEIIKEYLDNASKTYEGKKSLKLLAPHLELSK